MLLKGVDLGNLPGGPVVKTRHCQRSGQGSVPGWNRIEWDRTTCKIADLFKLGSKHALCIWVLGLVNLLRSDYSPPVVVAAVFSFFIYL